MEQYYSTHLFIDVIEGMSGIVFKTERRDSSCIIRFYAGLKGTVVMVDCSDEDISYTLCRDYFNQLGLSDLIPGIFPEAVQVSAGSTEE